MLTMRHKKAITKELRDQYQRLSKKEKKSRRGKIPKISKLSGKRTVTGQNSGKLYAKKHRRGNS